MVKVADGCNDPVGVSVADDGSGRIFVVERVGKVKVVAPDGKVQAEPFLDLTRPIRSAARCRPALSSRVFGRLRSIPRSRRTATYSCTMRRCPSTERRSSDPPLKQAEQSYCIPEGWTAAAARAEQRFCPEVGGKTAIHKCGYVGGFALQAGERI
jgi:hypothetical protein